jgi:superfamily II RNA helicase
MTVTSEDRSRYNKTWKENNPDKARESHRIAQKKWRDKNREKVRAVSKEWTRENRDKVNEYRRRQHYKQKYGITMEERDEMLASQGGCACCGGKEPGNKYGWVVDHCHAGGQVRGILCHHCNVALGNVKDDITHLKLLIAYLER